MSVYDPYAYRYPSYGAYPRQYPMYGVQGIPMARSYYSSYAPSTAYTTPYATYADDRYTTGGLHSGGVHENMYFSLNGKLIRSYKVRNYKRAQKHVLDLFPDLLSGIAASRIQFYVLRPGYSHGRYVGLKSYISKNAWPMDIDNLRENETVGIEVRPSISFAESVASFFNRSRVL